MVEISLSANMTVETVNGILNDSGGRVIDCAGSTLQYNKPNLVNPWFMAVGDPHYDWIGVCPELAG